jgi:hypothetical protein
LLIVLREARYEPADGAISKQRFTKLYQSFLKELSDDLDGRVGPRLVTVGTDIAAFWAGVLERCRT